MTELRLAVTDTDPSPIDLYDQTRFIVSTDAGGEPRFALVDGKLTLPIFCYGPTPATNFSLLARKLGIEAPAGAGPWGMAGKNVVLLMKLTGETAYSYVDVLGGVAVVLDPFGFQSKFAARIDLVVLPFARGAPVTYSGLSIAAGTGAVWLASIPGDMPALATVRLTDTSLASKVLNRARLGSHSHPSLATTDITPVQAVTPWAPGVAFTDATARGGTAARVVTSASAQALCRVSGPTSGAHNRRATILASVKSAVVTATTPAPPSSAASTPSLAAGSLGAGKYEIELVSKTAAGVSSLPGAAPAVAFDAPATDAGKTTVQTFNVPPASLDAYAVLATDPLTSSVGWTIGTAGGGGAGSSGSVTISAGTATITATNASSGQEHITASRGVPTGAKSVKATFTNTTNTSASQFAACWVFADGSYFVVTYIPASATWQFGKSAAAGTDYGGAPGIQLGSVSGQTIEFYFDGASIQLLVGGASVAAQPCANPITQFGIAASAGAGAFGTTTNSFTNLSFANGLQATATPSVPGTPFGLSATAGNAQATVNWVAPAANGSPILGYTVQALVGGVPSGQALDVGPTATSAIITGLTNGTAYTFQVRAANAVGYGAAGSSGSVTPSAGLDPTLRQITVNWTSDVAANNTYLYWRKTDTAGTVGPWKRISTGSTTSYTLSSETPVGYVLENPPTTTAGTTPPILVRASVAAQAANPSFVPGAWIPCVLQSSRWEILDLGGHNLPPSPVPQGQAAPPWLIQIEAMCPSGAPAVECDYLAVLDERRERTELASPGLATQRIWESDSRADGEGGTLLRSKSDNSIQGEASQSAPLHLGPGNTWLVGVLEVGDGSGNLLGDGVNAQATVDVTVTPRYALSAGV